jgi:hypothetical protein
MRSFAWRGVNYNPHAGTDQRTRQGMAGSNAYAGTDQSTGNGRAPRQGYDGHDNDKQSQSSNHHLTLPLSLLLPSN